MNESHFFPMFKSKISEFYFALCDTNTASWNTIKNEFLKEYGCKE